MSELLGKVIITGNILALTGLRVGGGSSGLKIGGVDLNVITDPWNRPYIPGSSIKGKTRSLMERFHGLSPTDRGMHLCQSGEAYVGCPVCKVWGTLGDVKKMGTTFTLTRLYVSDVYLKEDSITDEMRENIDLHWTEVKFETAINRLTGTAQDRSLRQVERVPAGAVFSPVHMVFNVYEEQDKALLKDVFIALQLLEHDYLGGMGSRGSGRVEFANLCIYWNSRNDYESGTVSLAPERTVNGETSTPALLIQQFDRIVSELK